MADLYYISELMENGCYYIINAETGESVNWVKVLDNDDAAFRAAIALCNLYNSPELP